MSRSSRRDLPLFARLFWMSLPATLVVYIFRGVGILTFIPGGFVSILILLTIVAGVLAVIEKTKRF